MGNVTEVTGVVPAAAGRRAVLVEVWAVWATRAVGFKTTYCLTNSSTVTLTLIFRLRDMRPDNVNRYLDVLVTEHQTALQRGRPR
jgi:hypothetical protein